MNNRKQRMGIIFVSAFLITYFNLYAQDFHESGGDAHGEIYFKISAGQSTQLRFNKAMIVLHHMTYPQARDMFTRAIEKDSSAPMLYYGYAITLFQPLWPTRPSPKELHQGWEAIQKAKSLGRVTEREQLLLSAAEGFFQNPDSADYWKRIKDWKEGIALAYSSYPNDHEIASFYALALLATIAPDKISSPNNAQAADILLKILNENPNHPGAMHYLIHANDTPGRERESAEILQQYIKLAPENPHALHMPTHIYTRRGEWKEVIDGNIKSAVAALKYPAGDEGQYVWDEFPHAVEYLIYGYLQTGNDTEALAQLKRLQSTTNLEPSFKVPFHLSSTRARYTLERKAWEEAASINPRDPVTIEWNKYPWPESISWFAKGIGLVHTGNSAEAKKCLQQVTDLENKTLERKEVLFARQIKMLRLELAAFILNKEGEADSALNLLTQAAELELTTPKPAVTPAPAIPAHELLGDLLFEQEKYSEALTAYKTSLENYPNRFNSLLGAGKSSAALNDRTAALSFYKQLVEISDNRSDRKELKEAENYTVK